MSIETLASQGRSRLHTGLAGMDSVKLKQMRDKNMRACFRHFDEIPHKMEFVARIHDKSFVDDAASRTVNSTWYALESTEGSIIWIAQGVKEQVDYKRLNLAAKQKVKMLLCVGEDSSQLRKHFEGLIPTIIDCPTMEYAVTRALYNDISGATVLYSPAAENNMHIEADGAKFKNEVNEL